MCQFWSVPLFRVRGLTFGSGVGGDEVRDLGKAVIKPEIECAWSGESSQGQACKIGEQMGDVIPVIVFPI